MNWNGQRNFLDHLIAKRTDPANAANLQASFDNTRRKRVQSAVTTRPVFLPLQFSMTAAAQTSPYRSITNSLSYDVIITGVKADSQVRSIVLRRTESESPLAYVGDEVNLYLRADDLAGVASTVGGGQQGVFYLPSPIVLGAGQRLTVEMFKTDTTAAAEVANIVFVGVRVFPASYADDLIDAQERNRIERFIQLRETPQIRFFKQNVAFDVAGVGGVKRNLYSPQVDEPLLLRGIRTTLRFSTIELGIQGEPQWTPVATPIWSLAGEDDLGFDNYQWFSKPIYLHSRNTIEISKITNGGIDSTLFDPTTGNTITWICETV